MRFIPHLLSVAGAGCLLFAIARGSGASLPYQDPTPEFLAVQRDQIRTAKLSAAAGAILMLAGLTWLGTYTMRPGQLQPNKLEQAILERIAHDEPWLQMPASGVRVLSREFTGVGGYTRFLCELPESKDDRHPGLKPLIRLPAVPSGMGAVLWCRASQPSCLELFTYGDDKWDGVYDGFYFDENTVA